MYCPNCKKVYPADFTGSFCINCGAGLVENPKEGTTGLNISDDAAIMGGVNVVTNDSHNTTTYDQSVVYNKSVVNNISKSTSELQQERTQSFLEQCKQAFSKGGGLISEEQRTSLETLRLSMGIDDAEAARIIEVARKSSGGRMTVLGTRDVTTLKNVDRYIENNSINMLKGQIPRLAAIARDYKVEEVLYKYNMLLAALNPEDLVKNYEKSVADEYWQTYWVAIAYMKLKRVAEAENAIVKLGHFTDYSEYNSLLLSVVSAFNENGAEEAISYIDALVPEQCSPMLTPFLNALYFELAPERAGGASRECCQFFIDNIVSLESSEDKDAARKAAEESHEEYDNDDDDVDENNDVDEDSDYDEEEEYENEDEDDEEEYDDEDGEEEGDHYDVILRDSGVMKLALVKLLKDKFDFSLSESKKIVDSAPCTIARKIPRVNAEVLKNVMEEGGAVMEILNSDTGAIEYRTSTPKSYNTESAKNVETNVPVAQTRSVEENRPSVPQNQANNNERSAVDTIFEIIKVVVIEILEALKRLVEFIRTQINNNSGK
ncbi:MAG: ribosomal protein L7/L12 [Bacteroidaceae bacterium]|nr:ribosomal protein L7/L12 [Bacteroidaceae bacterium]